MGNPQRDLLLRKWALDAAIAYSRHLKYPSQADIMKKAEVFKEYIEHGKIKD